MTEELRNAEDMTEDYPEDEETKRALQVYELTKQLAEIEGLTESMKSTDFLHWVGVMNNCKARAEEIIREEMRN
jgi:hypothetical protein